MANYTLKDDRTIEYQWVYDNLPAGAGLLLDVGSPQGYPLPGYAANLGWHVIAVDLNAQNATGGNVEYRRGDILSLPIPERFDYVLNISSVEHFGLAGRYNVTAANPDADLQAMTCIAELMTPTATMLLTVPVGIDTVVNPLHRVYGTGRLPYLLERYAIIKEAYFSKRDGIDNYIATSKEDALSTVAIARSLAERAEEHYYALGCFELKLK
jgi:hypothetical protein